MPHARNARARPASPYTSYSLISDDDALAIRAYLASLAPIRSPATENTLIFPFNQRYLMRSWKLLFLSSRRFELDTSRSEGWNRGAYLARARPGVSRRLSEVRALT